LYHPSEQQRWKIEEEYGIFDFQVSCWRKNEKKKKRKQKKNFVLFSPASRLAIARQEFLVRGLIDDIMCARFTADELETVNTQSLKIVKINYLG
jgi:hypothetical protein